MNMTYMNSWVIDLMDEWIYEKRMNEIINEILMNEWVDGLPMSNSMNWLIMFAVIFAVRYATL